MTLKMLILAQKYSPLETLLHPFELIIWILLLLTFGVGLLVIFVINHKFKNAKELVYGKNVKSPVMNMTAAILGLNQSVLPTRNFPRFILMMFLIFCLVNRNIYQGALYLFLQSDNRHKDIQSIKEMEDRNFSYYVYESYINFVDNQSSIFKRKIIVREEPYDLPFSKKIDENLKAAYMAPQTEIINRNRLSRGKFTLKVCAEQVSVMNIAIFYTRNFYLKYEIDVKLRQFDAAGLLGYWINKHADKRYLAVKKRSSGPKKLNVRHLSGVFKIMLMGHAVATVVFIFELLVYKIKQVRIKKCSVNVSVETPNV
jgi:hypothetical protein